MKLALVVPTLADCTASKPLPVTVTVAPGPACAGAKLSIAIGGATGGGGAVSLLDPPPQPARIATAKAAAARQRWMIAVGNNGRRSVTLRAILTQVALRRHPIDRLIRAAQSVWS
ncbi:MAG: hypothetical protein N3D71_08430 [Burkholderiaceae bacterium]|nr:hypothetical protein [Burkholderiaceae bacterium]